MKKNILITLGVIFGVLLIFGLYCKGQYDKAITLDEAVSGQWAQVENQLQRRFDLIPNLVETVKGYAKHEQETFTKIAEVRKS